MRGWQRAMSRVRPICRSGHSGLRRDRLARPYGHDPQIQCPFTGESVTAVPALRPDVAIIHAQRADQAGNVQLWGIVGLQKEAVLSARRNIVTVEEVVESLTPVPNAVVLPSWVVDAVCLVPNGAHPSYAMGFTSRDNTFYQAWDAISKDRVAFTDWIDRHILRTSDHSEF